MNEKIMKFEDSYDFYKDEVHCLYEEKTSVKILFSPIKSLFLQHK